MKYIRTVYGDISCITDEQQLKNILRFNKEYILKATDKIEELGDIWLVNVGDKETAHDEFYFTKKETLTNIKFWYPIINYLYLMIWIDLENGAKRLEPIAKMDDKGELELL